MMSTSPKIAVLLSTYNGAIFLAEQLDSLLMQSYTNFVIVVRDDGSVDGTVALLQSYAEKNSNLIHLLPQDKDNKGASAGFAFLIEYVLANKSALGLQSAYMMFCDQDDTWYPDKIEKQVAAMLAAEGDSSVESGQHSPILIHSDLEVVSEQNTVIAKSFISYQGLEIQRNTFPNLVISNLVTGCTALINEPLAAKAIPIPKNAIMHDWWLALVATAFGQLVFLDTPLVHYRQHGNNTIGAKQFIKTSAANRSFWRRVLTRKPNQHLIEVSVQAIEFRRRFAKEISARQRSGLRVCGAMGIKIGLLQRLMYRLARRF